MGAGERRVAPDGLEEGEAEPRLAHGVDERAPRPAAGGATGMQYRSRPSSAKTTSKRARSPFVPGTAAWSTGTTSAMSRFFSPNHRRLPSISRSAAAARAVSASAAALGPGVPGLGLRGRGSAA